MRAAAAAEPGSREPCTSAVAASPLPPPLGSAARVLVTQAVLVCVTAAAALVAREAGARGHYACTAGAGGAALYLFRAAALAVILATDRELLCGTGGIEIAGTDRHGRRTPRVRLSGISRWATFTIWCWQLQVCGAAGYILCTYLYLYLYLSGLGDVCRVFHARLAYIFVCGACAARRGGRSPVFGAPQGLYFAAALLVPAAPAVACALPLLLAAAAPAALLVSGVNPPFGC